ILDEGKIDLGPDSSKEKMINYALGEVEVPSEAKSKGNVASSRRSEANHSDGEKDEKSDSEFVDENEVSSGKSKSSFAANPETKEAKVLAENTEGTLGRSLFSREDDDKEKSKETVVSPDYVKDGASSYGSIAEYDEVAASTAGTVDPPEAKGDMVAGIGTKVKTSFYGVSDPDFSQFSSVSCELKKCGLERKHLGEVFRDRSPTLQLLDKVTDQIAVEDSVDLSYAAVGPLDFVAVEDVLEKQSGEGNLVTPNLGLGFCQVGDKKPATLARGFCAAQLDAQPRRLARPDFRHGSSAIGHTGVQPSLSTPLASCLGQPPESQCASRHLMARARGAPPW
ncbi:hypothetical protein U1Q18_050005, partial [Sarracenia purpurea var. burkii]